MTRFHWVGYDVSTLLPAGWMDQVAQVALNWTGYRDLPRTPLNSRELADFHMLKRGRVAGEIVRAKLPWLYDAYHGMFAEMAAAHSGGEVMTANDDRYGVVLNVAVGTEMRFECHVDSNPLEGLLFCTNQPPGSGGELVVANSQIAEGVKEIDSDCTEISPKAGHLIFFDARQYPHYVRALTKSADMRIVAAMNYYTRSNPESLRPSEINTFLFEN